MSDPTARPDAAAGDAPSDRTDRTIDRAAPDIELSFDGLSAQPILAAAAAFESEPAHPVVRAADAVVAAAEAPAASVVDAADPAVETSDAPTTPAAPAPRSSPEGGDRRSVPDGHRPRAADAVAPASVGPSAPRPVGPSDPASDASAASAAETPAAAAAEAASVPAPDILVVPELHVAAHVEAPSPDIAAPAAETTLPGAHRGGFTRPPTAPVEITEEKAEFVPATGPVLTPPMLHPANFAATGLGFAIVGLIASIVVGVAFPIGVTAVVLGALSLRRPFESRTIAVWTIVLGAVSVVYSAGWLVWAAYRAGWVG